MTMVNSTSGDTTTARRPPNGREPSRTTQQTSSGAGQSAAPVNVGQGERAVSMAAGGILAMLGLSRHSMPGLLVAGVGGAMLYRGATGHCHAYEALGIDTSEGNAETEDEQLARRGIHVEQAFLINRPAAELYRFWRDFRNLPRIMTHIERIDVQDERRSHWVARVSRLAGGRLEWDAELTRDEPDRVIAWHSLPGSEVQTTGEVRFAKALGDRGTEVHATMNFVPPGAAVARMFPSLFTKATRLLVREDLRRFKQLMETGEIPTIDGQPHGTCTGSGTRYHES